MSVSIVADLGVQPGVSSKMVGCVLFWILNFNFMLIFENLYLLLGKSKNGNCGLFGNLKKRSMQ
jgi:hypothetical protein